MVRTALWQESETQRPPFPNLPEQRTINYRFAARWGDRIVPLNQDNSNRGQPLHAMALERGLIDLGGYQPVFRELQRLATEHDFIPVIVYTPTAGSVYGKNIEYEDGTLNATMATSARLQRQYLMETASRLEMIFLDLTSGMEAAASVGKGDNLLYYPDTLHLSSTGHRVIAEIVAKQLPKLSARQRDQSP